MTNGFIPLLCPLAKRGRAGPRLQRWSLGSPRLSWLYRTGEHSGGCNLVGLTVAQFLAIVLTALALVPAGAHLSELLNKIDLSQEEYFVVQSIYRGWALFGIVLFGALAANLILAVLVRRQRAPFWLALLASLLVAATLVIFFTWTYPANQATSNWTVVPENWQELRLQWEYAHVTNAVLTFLALCAVTLSVLLTRR
jgi:ribose/xylose/arabinose/galactoside ABC-type transport system permease subunit